MGGPKQKGIATYSKYHTLLSISVLPCKAKLNLFPTFLLALSPFRQDPMRGAYKHWAVNGVKRLGQQAVYFAVPFGLGTQIPLSLCHPCKDLGTHNLALFRRLRTHSMGYQG